MKKLYFFTMLSIMLLAVTGATAQKKTKFKAADLKGIWQLCHYAVSYTHLTLPTT